jgi:hypothetical protein
MNNNNNILNNSAAAAASSNNNNGGSNINSNNYNSNSNTNNNNNNNAVNNVKGSVPISNINSRKVNNNHSSSNNNGGDHVVTTTRNISIPLPLPKNHSDENGDSYKKSSQQPQQNAPVKGKTAHKNDSRTADISLKGECGVTLNNVKHGGSTLKVSETEDLIHLNGPLTEDAVMKTLHARFSEKKFFVSESSIWH